MEATAQGTYVQASGSSVTRAAHLTLPCSEHTPAPRPGRGVGVRGGGGGGSVVVVHGCSFSGTIPARLSLTVYSESLCLGNDTDTSPSLATHEPVCHHQFVSGTAVPQILYISSWLTQDHRLPSYKCGPGGLRAPATHSGWGLLCPGFVGTLSCSHTPTGCCCI